MLYRKLFLIIFLSSIGNAFAQKDNAKPVPIIFDSDIGPDYDDVGAITILHVLEERGEANILATIASNKYEGIAGVLDVFNTYFNRPGIPIGLPKEEGVDIGDLRHWTDTILARYPHTIKYNKEVPGAVDVYRKILAAQPDHSVTIVTVGFLTNLADLLKSSGDKISVLNGVELVKKKVKILVSMAGRFPSGKEFNVIKDSVASKNALENWPTTVIFSGFEIGQKIITGLPLIHNDAIQQSPVKDAFSIAIAASAEDTNGRMSWDETAVLVAVKGYEQYFTLHPGRIIVHDDGSNAWDDSKEGQFYLIQKATPETMQDVINRLIMQQPKKK